MKHWHYIGEPPAWDKIVDHSHSNGHLQHGHLDLEFPLYHYGHSYEEVEAQIEDERQELFEKGVII